jgi:lauroyl/myristoyl acyltransferase
VNKKNKVLELIEFLFVKFIFSIFKLFNYKKGIKFGSKLFQILYFIPLLKKIAYKNLDIIFYDYENYSNKNNINLPFKLFKKKVYLKNLQNLGKIFFSIIYLPKIELLKFENIILKTDINYIKEILNRDKGFIAVTLHCGNWEIMGTFFSQLGLPINVIMRPLDNKLLNNYLEKFRTDKGLKIISKFDSPIKFLRPVLKNEILAILADQNTLKHGIFIPFFKRIASSNQGAAKIHLLTKGELLLIYSYYDNDKLIIENEPYLNIFEEYNKIDKNLKIKLFIFNYYFNLKNISIPISFFNDLVDLSNYNEKIVNIDQTEKDKIIESFENKIYQKLFNFDNLEEEEKIFFINYIIHKKFEIIIKNHPDNWMLIHERWKKQPANFSYLYK